MKSLTTVLSLLQIFSTALCCLPGLPGPFGFGLNPALTAPFYGGGIAPGYGMMGGPRPMGPMGPFRSEGRGGQAAAAAAPQISPQMDDMQSAATLNCPGFLTERECHWGNTADEELDWSAVSRTPGADRWYPLLGVHTYPDTSAAVLMSGPRQGWEGGRLASDYVSCIGSDLRITATAWRSKDASQLDQPKLQVCTRNQGEEKMPLVNCNDFEIRNGVPMTVEVPAANEPMNPAQIVFNGYNFMGQQGGAIFLQDIVVEGSLSCNTQSHSSFDSNPTLIQETLTNTVRNPDVPRNSLRSPGEPVGPLKAVDGLAGLEAIDAAPRSFEKFDQRAMLSQLQNALDQNGAAKLQSSMPAQGTVTNALGSTPTLFESCLALSCNPSDLSCKFWRSAGDNRWEIGSTTRVSNPLTGIHLPPGTSQKFLVAPFLDSHINSYTLVSESITVPPLQNVYFCFYEYYATHGLSLNICTDKMDCFYRKNSLTMGNGLQENKRWNIRCAKLPMGTYECGEKGHPAIMPAREAEVRFTNDSGVRKELVVLELLCLSQLILRVVAENNADNKGEVGFLPIRLSRDPEGLDFIC